MKKLCLILIVVLTAAIFEGCGAGNKSTVAAPPGSSAAVAASFPAEKKPIEISVITSYGGDDGNRQNYERAFMAYEAATGNVVKDDSGISNEEWKARVMAGFESGTEPDVLFYFTGADSNKLVGDGRVVPIDEIRGLYPDYASNMRDDMLAKSPVDGKNYAVPVNGYWEGLFVNKKVLADCEVEVPGADTTWDRFIEDCAKIAAKGYIPIAASLNEVPHYWFEFCVLNNGGLESHAQLPETSSDPVGRNWAAGLNDIKDLYMRGFFPENTLTAANAETDVLMTDNRAAFMIDGSWKMGWFAENAADINDFTVTYVPNAPGRSERKPTDIISGLSMGYFITRKAWDDPEKQAACVEFVTAMTTDEVVATFGATSVTALKNVAAPPSDASNLVKDALAMTRNITGIVSAAGDRLLPNSRSDLFASGVKEIVTGGMTAEEAIDRCLAIKD